MNLEVETGTNTYAIQSARGQSDLNVSFRADAAPELRDVSFGAQTRLATPGIDLGNEFFPGIRNQFLRALAGDLGMKLVTAPIKAGIKAMVSEPEK